MLPGACVYRVTKAEIDHGKKEGYHQTTRTGGSKGHEQEQPHVCEQGKSRQGTANTCGPQQGQGSQQGKNCHAKPPEGKAPDAEILIQ